MRYRLRIEDEAHVRDVCDIRFTRWQMLLLALAAVVLIGLIVTALVVWTPVHSALPGYMNPNEREALMAQVQRVDSMQRVLDINQNYVDNIRSILDPERDAKADSLRWSTRYHVSTDTLMTATERERRFNAKMEESQRYALTIIEPLAASSLIFADIAHGAVYENDSREAFVARAVVPRSSTINAISDATVIDTYFSPAGGYVILLQHSGGFLSRISRLGAPLVKVGDRVMAGEAIAPTASGLGLDSSVVELEMWHDGEPLVPYAIISNRYTDI